MTKRSLFLLGLSALALVAAPSFAEDKEFGWFDVAEFSFVATEGNSETQTIGLKNSLTRVWEKQRFGFFVGGVRAQSRPDTFTGLDNSGSDVVGDPFTLLEPPTETTAENYFANLRFDRDITEHFFWYTQGGWQRNRPGGIQNRFSAGGGVGNQWINRDDLKFRTDYGLTYTDEEQVTGFEDSFAGARTSWGYLNKLTETATYTNDLVLDLNLDETDDFRADMINSLSVSISQNVALKTSLQFLYDNMPAFAGVPVFGTDVNDIDNDTNVTEVIRLRTENVERDDLDTIFSASLVINF